ncbi:hypothetical protein CR156_14955 [Stenotrophomonas lactitubi]|uniref:hypothetical protein n=1 Tax=Stenotrophomonas TaxID=40323 RepID=UPI000C2756A7|nr:MULTISPECIES: hypothetical protein [Stenotrophomonas]MBA0250493.1 hypothetical protein [Stenotrophomonas maltophilia]MBA0320005.1 hypothetical protein [Stenotrophomonas maltophilia]PJO54420.1 hypothetical protein CR156_14955 [Stenotrophomonas lactitubi]
MKVKIVSIHGHGDESKEYVLLRVLDDCDIGKYQLSDTTYIKDNTVSNKLRHVYWFPDKEVSKGDLVSLWTGIGKQATVKNANGETVHRFFWGLKSAIWNDTGDAAVLQHVDQWSHFSAKA